MIEMTSSQCILRTPSTVLLRDLNPELHTVNLVLISGWLGVDMRVSSLNGPGQVKGEKRQSAIIGLICYP